jgi:hypothetical protein
MATIDDLLRALQNPNEGNVKLRNDFTTWQRIGNKDDFTELGLSGGELEDFLKDWISENEYSNI